MLPTILSVLQSKEKFHINVITDSVAIAFSVGTKERSRQSDYAVQNNIDIKTFDQSIHLCLLFCVELKWVTQIGFKTFNVNYETEYQITEKGFFFFQTNKNLNDLEFIGAFKHVFENEVASKLCK